jgi:tocopherol O-methyltransferase
MPVRAVLDDAPAVTKRAIRFHYDMATPFYRLLWGVHIHHGLWRADEGPRAAQEQLLEHLAAAADIPHGADVLDVGCGLGGTSIALARGRGCRVTAVTLSPLQCAWARLRARRQGVGKRVRFLCRDAEQATFPPESFDVVWSVECTEHLFDKARFFDRAAGWLRPGGRVAVCAWLAGDRPHSPAVARAIDAVCRGFLCPSLGTAADYAGWMRQAGLDPYHFEDLTPRVERTWEICRRRVRRTGVRWLARCAGRKMTRFVDHFDTIREAYRSGAMRYGCFVAQG